MLNLWFMSLHSNQFLWNVNCISLVSVNWTSWPHTHVMWLRQYLQGTWVPPRELCILLKWSLQWNLIGHSKLIWMQVLLDPLCVCRATWLGAWRVAATKCGEGLAARVSCMLIHSPCSYSSHALEDNTWGRLFPLTWIPPGVFSKMPNTNSSAVMK